MKKIGFVLALVLTLAMLTAMTSPAFADASGAGFAEGSAAGSYDGSLFTAGGSVDSSAQVKGVQFAAGSDVQVQGVCEYLMAAGNQLVFSGDAESDAFAAGNNVYIYGNVGRDLFAAGSTVEIRGSVERSAYIAASSVVIDGSIGGDLYLSADKIVISDSTKIGGTVHPDMGKARLQVLRRGFRRLRQSLRHRLCSAGRAARRGGAADDNAHRTAARLRAAARLCRGDRCFSGVPELFHRHAYLAPRAQESALLFCGASDWPSGVADRLLRTRTQLHYRPRRRAARSRCADAPAR